MIGEFILHQIDIDTLNRVADCLQKEPMTLIDLYLKDSEKLLTKLKAHIQNTERQYIQQTLKELRQSSLDVGALKFSFLVLAFEITTQEYRVQDWTAALKRIEIHYHSVIDELATLHYAHRQNQSLSTPSQEASTL